MKFTNGFLGHDDDIEFNSLGHRCREINELNLHNYVLFAGDNIGVGLGTSLEKTYPYLVAKKLKCDYYNLCVFNGGLDALKINLFHWFSSIQQRPRAVIISFEHVNALLVSDLNHTFLEPSNLNNEETKSLIAMANTNGFFNARLLLADNMFKHLLNVPVYQIVFKDKLPIFQKNITNVFIEDDIFNHEKISDNLTALVKAQNVKIKP